MRASTNAKRTLLPMLTLLIATALGGCYARARVYTPTPSATVAIRTAPPPPRYEAIPVAPGPSYVWAGGHWSWGGSRYVWVPGRYVVRPAANYVWRRPVWVRRSGHYHYVPGRWTARARGRVIIRGRGRP